MTHQPTRFDPTTLSLPDGNKKPYRPLPADFRERFLEMGWSKEIQEHYHTNWRVIRRWIEEAGGEELRACRSQITGAPVRPLLRTEARAKDRTRVAAVTKRLRREQRKTDGA